MILFLLSKCLSVQLSLKMAVHELSEDRWVVNLLGEVQICIFDLQRELCFFIIELHIIEELRFVDWVTGLIC